MRGEQVNNGTHETTSTCTTIVRGLSQSPRNPPTPPAGMGTNGDDATNPAIVPQPTAALGGDAAKQASSSPPGAAAEAVVRFGNARLLDERECACACVVCEEGVLTSHPPPL